MESKYKKAHSMEVVRYEFDYVDGDPKIIISQIKLLDENGKYIRFIGMKEVAPHLHRLPIKFKNI